MLYWKQMKCYIENKWKEIDNKWKVIKNIHVILITNEVIEHKLKCYW